MDSFDFVNFVKDPTCFRQSPSSQLDVILTNKSKKNIREPLPLKTALVTFTQLCAQPSNNYFINVALNIGNKIKPDCDYSDHPGAKIIREYLTQHQNLSLREVAKILHSINSKKGNWPSQTSTKTN